LITTFKDLVNQAIDAELVGKTAEGAKGVRDQYRKVTGYLNQVKAASCLPEDVRQALQDYANERKNNPGNTNDECNTLCGKTTDWIARMTGDDRFRQTFWNNCISRCQ
jgi:hypothetical protein